MRLLQSTWAELLTLTLAFRSLEQFGDQKSDGNGDLNNVGSFNKENSNSLKLRYASDYWLDEQLARECCSTLLSNGTTSATSSTTICTASTTPTVLDIYNLVSIKINQNNYNQKSHKK